MIVIQLINSLVERERRLDYEKERRINHQTEPYANYLAPIQARRAKSRTIFGQLFPMKKASRQSVENITHPVFFRGEWI